MTVAPVKPSEPSVAPVLKTPAEVIREAAGSALRGGVAGAIAQGANVFALMWMRTIMNYQYRYGGGLRETAGKLYSEGGIPRFYRGLVPALMQAPLSRFGDTAANVGVLALLDSYDSTRELAIPVKTAAASAGAALFRVLLMPIDAWKTTKQVEGASGMKALLGKVRTNGISHLWGGAMAASGATFVGHYPWFVTHNSLSVYLPQFGVIAGSEKNGKMIRNALIGFTASVVSDSISNSLRVIKTTKQTAIEPLTYPQTYKLIISKDGFRGLLGRGLKTRIITNGMQGMLFSVMWKAIEDQLKQRGH